jgi:hypothetical protein
MKLKIAFGDQMGVGKDTCVEYLIEKYGGVKVSFAEPLYDILNYAQKVCNYKSEKDRKFLQFVGTEWARSINENVWVELLLQKSRSIDDNMFVSDIRFINELTALKDDGWTCVKLNRCSVDDNRKGSGTTKHDSEKGIVDERWDYVISNDDTLEELYRKLDDIVKMI